MVIQLEYQKHYLFHFLFYSFKLITISNSNLIDNLSFFTMALEINFMNQFIMDLYSLLFYSIKFIIIFI